jgi:DNA invertase Pin-like site-specific DNA recombinase
MAKRASNRNQTTAVVYCRVSALDSQSESDASLEQQERTLTAMAEAAGYTELVVIRERHTGSKAQPELEAALALLDDGTYAALYAAKIDRLSRKGAGDVLRIADKAERHGWRLVVADVSMDTGTTVGRLVLTILSGVAEMESRRRSERMTEYHAARRARGEVAGVHYGARSTAEADVAERILAAWIAGQSFAAIARSMEQEQGRPWHATQVRRIVRAHSAQPLATIAA